QDYLYPHNYPGNWVKQDYLPEKIRNHHYFQAEDTGKYERALAQRKEAIDRLRKI
ncbi:TPA: replication-associated recombination protein A, partial [Streptococcus pneumoniae]